MEQINEFLNLMLTICVAIFAVQVAITNGLALWGVLRKPRKPAPSVLVARNGTPGPLPRNRRV